VGLYIREAYSLAAPKKSIFITLSSLTGYYALRFGGAGDWWGSSLAGREVIWKMRREEKRLVNIGYGLGT
jgi:hypothetical protein